MIEDSPDEMPKESFSEAGHLDQPDYENIHRHENLKTLIAHGHSFVFSYNDLALGGNTLFP